jgi:predicted GNAT superfamily acetyltransferase
MSLSDEKIVPVEPTKEWLKRVAVLAGVWPESDEDNVPSGILDAIADYHGAMLAAAPASKANAGGVAVAWMIEWQSRSSVTLPLIEFTGHAPANSVVRDAKKVTPLYAHPPALGEEEIREIVDAHTPIVDTRYKCRLATPTDVIAALLEALNRGKP